MTKKLRSPKYVDNLKERSWEADVSAYDRWANFAKLYSHSTIAVMTAEKRMKQLQDRWPNHKLGEHNATV